MSAESHASDELVPMTTMPTGIQSADPVAHAIAQLRITWSNVPYDSDEAETLMLSSVGECDLSGDDVIGSEIAIVGCLIRTVTLTDKETGELFDKPRTIFLLEDGRTLSFISVGILESLSVLASRRPKGRWNPPIAVKVKQIALANGHRKYVFVPLPKPLVAVKPNGGKHGK